MADTFYISHNLERERRIMNRASRSCAQVSSILAIPPPPPTPYENNQASLSIAIVVPSY